MAKNIREIFDFFRKLVDGNDLKAAGEIVSGLADSLTLVNINSLFILENKVENGGELYFIVRDLSDQAFVCFITDFFIRNPLLQESINKKVTEIRTRLVQDFDGDTTIN